LVAVWFDGLTLANIRIGVLRVDGLDSTDVIVKLLRRTRTDVIFLSGITFAGFNIVDSTRLHDTFHIPIIVVCREKPNNRSVKRALQKHFTDWKKRWELVRELGRIYSFAPKTSEQPLHFEAVGISAADAKKMISAYCVTSRVPEPIRVAGILAKGLALTGSELAIGRHEVSHAELQRLKVHHRKQARRRL
jgi:endonuclease V-like protein UPF0215 family